MNIQSKINKLLVALRQKGYVIKLNTTQYYSEEKEKIITKYILWESHPKEGETYYSKIDILKRLIEIYKEVGGADG
ncbi:hypothetical protein [Clostridium cadaveris]|uniref:hypothetical protein n=1 Tax=Clostridium cadaveris TaxID=1529 RepID=UPI0031E0DFC8